MKETNREVGVGTERDKSEEEGNAGEQRGFQLVCKLGDMQYQYVIQEKIKRENVQELG